MITSRRIRILPVILAGLILLVADTVYSQNTGRVNRYTTSSAGTGVNSISSSGSAITLTNNDDGYGTTTLPFPFNYDSTAFPAGSGFLVNSNGFAAFGTSNSSMYSSCCSDWTGNSTYAQALTMWSYDDILGSGAVVYQLVSGSSPNRVWTLEWTNLQFWSGATSTCTMQIKLYETTNIIDYCYASNGTSIGSGVAGVGLNGTSTGGFVYKRYGSAGGTTPSPNVRWTPPPPPVPPAQLSANPKTLNFGGVVGGNPTSLTFQIRSLGPGTLIFGGSLSISGAPDFTVTGPVPPPHNLDSLQAGQNMTVTVTFNPVTGGTRTATLTVSTNGRDSGVQNINLTGVGIAPAVQMSTTSLFRKVRIRLGDSSSQTFPVTSNGTGPLTFNSFPFSGLNPNEYKVTRTPANPLAVGLTDSITVTYYPTFEGRPDATLSINSNALNAPSLQVTMFGTGILPRLVLTPSPLAFGNVPTGQTDTMQVTLSNPGSDTVRILRDYLSSSDADYKIIPLAKTDTAIAPNASKTISVIFTPVKQGTRRATLRVTTNIPLTFESVRRDTSAFTVDITGIGVPFGKLSLTGPLLDSAIVGQQQCATDTIWNTGTADLQVTSIKVSGFDSSDFSISGVTLPLTLAPGAFQVANICFKPSARGLRHTNGTLTGVTSGVTQVITLPIIGYGLQVCAQADLTTLFATDKPITNSTTTGTASNTITITNCGDIGTSYSASLDSTTSAAYTITGSATSAVVLPGGSATFTVVFKPTVRGPANGTLVIKGGSGVTPISVQLNGIGYNADITGTGTALSTAVGNCSDFDVTVTNNGNMDWTSGSTATFTGGTEFTMVAGATITAGGGTGKLSFRFCPTATGSRTATATFPNQAPDMLMTSINLSGTGTPTSGVAIVSELNGFRLDQNYPNPVGKMATQIHFVTPQSASVNIVVTDLTGAVVSRLTNDRYDMGDHTVSFDASNLASGTYFYTLTSGDVRLTRQMVLSK